MNTIRLDLFLLILVSTAANGYPNSKQSTVEINESPKARNNAFICSVVPMDLIFSNVNAPLLSVKP